MAASEYCTAEDLHNLGGLPRGALPNPGRLVASVDASANVCTLDGHGFATNTPLWFRAEAGGALPSPLVEGTSYFAIALTESRFSVSATFGGSAIDLTTTGGEFVAISPLPKTAAIQFASAIVDDSLWAARVPMTVPYPVTVVAITAILAASYLLSFTGQLQGTLADAIASARTRMADWARGVTVSGPNAPPPANMAVLGTGRAADPRGYLRCGREDLVP